LEIKTGEFFSLLGPSGCGKSTLLRMIAGFESPTSGSIVISGKDMVAVPPHKRPVNMVFQSYALFPHLSVFENVAFGLRSTKACNPKEISSRVQEALSVVRLETMAQRYPSQLSGGQQQRVALARAIVNKPEVLLLDEPLSALDLKIREEMQNELANLQKRLQMTFIMVTHDQGEALALSHRIAVFNRGQIEQVGTPVEIYEQPQSIFVADFVGQTNMYPAKFLQSDGAYASLKLDNDLLLTARNNPRCSGIKSGAAVILWMRTQSLHIWRNEPPDRANGNLLSAVVANKSYQGDSTCYFLKGAGNSDLIIKVSSSNNGQEAFSVGDQVFVEIPADNISFFATEECAKSVIEPSGIEFNGKRSLGDSLVKDPEAVG
ncbi:MAG: ABC transporter ATP-binding protein, partial [Candidatus Obscuribacterales bacterium]|nr:ABC transporter ATP-binding protein [Candidatus Obscuribacterales bacterium]